MQPMLLTSDNIQRFGANSYLADLRRQFALGTLSRETYVNKAARAYLQAGLPRRALALDSALELPQTCAAQPTCTLTMIVRNEESNIEAVLDSVDTLFDQIVICDTGSTDLTVAKASLYGTAIVNRPWDDDFSAARNAAIDLASCNWIFWMDADDRLSMQDGQVLKNHWQTASPHCALVRVVNIRDGHRGNEFLQARLFPRQDGLRFERRIHEQIMPAVSRAALPFSLCDSIEIVHTGYDSPESNSAKAARNERLINRELVDIPGDLSLTLSLGDARFVQGNFDGAREAYEAIVEQKGAAKAHRDVWVQAHYYLALTHLNLGETAQASHRLRQTVILDESRIEAWYQLGVLYRDSGTIDNAIVCLDRARNASPVLRMTTADNNLTRIRASADLAALYLQTGRTSLATEVLEQAIKLWPMVPLLHTLAGQAAMTLHDLRGAAHSFMQAISMAPQSSPAPFHGMAGVYEALGDHARAAEFTARANHIETGLVSGATTQQ